MIVINKQKFLAELGRLLTFMYEEDRQTVLGMYGRMFDETADEEGLLELLVSPTRQAVVLARSYDAKARKAQLEAQDADADYIIDPDNAPAFIFIIDKTAQQAAELGIKEAPVDENQFSIFDGLDALPELEEPAAAPAAEELPELEEVSAPPEAEEAEAESEVPVLPAVSPIAEAEPEAGEEDAARSDVDDTADAVDAFLADFTIENGELVFVKDEAEAESEAGEAEEPEEAEMEVFESETEEAEKPVEYRKKTNILLLIAYLIPALPMGILGLALLLVIAALFLGLAGVCGYVGVQAIVLAFGSFAVIADTMAVFGAGLALVALALLFVWLFVWFLGGAMAGYVRGLCRLGAKICCKEVAVK